MLLFYILVHSLYSYFAFAGGLLPPFIIFDLHSHLSHHSLLYFQRFLFLQVSEI